MYRLDKYANEYIDEYIDYLRKAFIYHSYISFKFEIRGAGHFANLRGFFNSFAGTPAFCL